MSRAILMGARSKGVAADVLDLSTGGTRARALAAWGQISAPTTGGVGFLQSFGVNALRIVDHGDGNGACLLMEKPSTNRLLRSRDITHADWALPGAATVAANAGPGPDGATSADRVTATSANFSPGQALGGLLANPHTLSAYGRAYSGTADWETNYGPFPYTAWSGSIGTTWVRKRETKATTGGNLYAEDGSLSSTAADVLVDMWQAEDGLYATSPIDTAGTAVTRPGDELSYASSSYPASFLTDGVVIEVVCDASNAEAAGEIWPFLFLGTNEGVYLDADGTIKLLIAGSVVATLSAPTWSAGQKLTITARPADGFLGLDGATTGNGTVTGTGAAWGSGQTLYIGADNTFSVFVGCARYVGARIVQSTSLPAFDLRTGGPSLILDERGQSAALWADQSGNGRDFAQASGPAQPATGRTINGLAALDFGGSAYLEGPTLTSLVSASSYHGLLVILPDTISSNTGVPYIDDAIFGDVGDWLWVTGRNNSGTRETQCGHFDSGVQNTQASPATLAAAHIIDVSFDGSTITQRLDAGSAVTHAAGNIGGTSLARIGWGSPSASLFDGAIGQIVWFRRKLNASEQASWRSYLGGKWGVSV